MLLAKCSQMLIPLRFLPSRHHTVLEEGCAFAQLLHRFPTCLFQTYLFKFLHGRKRERSLFHEWMSLSEDKRFFSHFALDMSCACLLLCLTWHFSLNGSLESVHYHYHTLYLISSGQIFQMLMSVSPQFCRNWNFYNFSVFFWGVSFLYGVFVFLFPMMIFCRIFPWFSSHKNGFPDSTPPPKFVAFTHLIVAQGFDLSICTSSPSLWQKSTEKPIKLPLHVDDGISVNSIL